MRKFNLQLFKSEIDKLSPEQKQKLLEAKQGYANAKTNEERAKFSAIGDQIRAGAGIQAGSQGLLSADELQANINASKQPQQQFSDTDFIKQQMEASKALTDIQKQQTTAQFTNLKNQATAGFNAEQAQVEPRYRDAKIGQKSASEQGQQSFVNFLAQTGRIGSGDVAKYEGRRRASLRDVLGGLEQGKQETLSDIAKRRQQAELSLDGKLAESLLAIDAKYTESKLSAIQSAIESQQRMSEDQLNSELRKAEEEAKQLNRVQLEDIKRDNEIVLKGLEAEIKDALNANDHERELELKEVQALINEKQAIIEGNLRISLEREKGAQDRATATTKSTLTKEDVDKAISIGDYTKVSDKVTENVNKAVNDASAKAFASKKPFGEADKQKVRMQVVERELNSLNTLGVDARILQAIADSYGFDVEFE